MDDDKDGHHDVRTTKTDEKNALSFSKMSSKEYLLDCMKNFYRNDQSN